MNLLQGAILCFCGALACTMLVFINGKLGVLVRYIRERNNTDAEYQNALDAWQIHLHEVQQLMNKGQYDNRN